jgi:hypothetical protein
VDRAGGHREIDQKTIRRPDHLADVGLSDGERCGGHKPHSKAREADGPLLEEATNFFP